MRNTNPNRCKPKRLDRVFRLSYAGRSQLEKLVEEYNRTLGVDTSEQLSSADSLVKGVYLYVEALKTRSKR